ncbi:hypothetical protein AB0C33_26190 [Nonomuraea sp. NPDC048881]|uniref:hypothetical protein n=1 Tax=Nonomuraea sp. NPDC048881 TaxID=3155030 RepID=UPI0033F29EFB
MRLHFIGTGSIFTDRMSASALIDGTLLVDTPNGSVKAMRRGAIDLTAIDLCLITHLHADHFFDIIFLLREQGLLRERDRELVLLGPAGLEERVRPRRRPMGGPRPGARLPGTGPAGAAHHTDRAGLRHSWAWTTSGPWPDAGATAPSSPPTSATTSPAPTGPTSSSPPTGRPSPST